MLHNHSLIEYVYSLFILDASITNSSKKEMKGEKSKKKGKPVVQCAFQIDDIMNVFSLYTYEISLFLIDALIILSQEGDMPNEEILELPIN